MSEQKPQIDRTEVMFRNIRQYAAEQSTPEHRENYFRSCEAHGSDLANVIAQVRKEYETPVSV
jgi:hypothetical protein